MFDWVVPDKTEFCAGITVKKFIGFSPSSISHPLSKVFRIHHGTLCWGLLVDHDACNCARKPSLSRGMKCALQ
eukprot:339153-Amphidinium_carterae.1